MENIVSYFSFGVTLIHICHLRLFLLIVQGDAGPHLVVAPVATLENWIREFEMWCPALSVVKYHGDEATKANIRRRLASDDEIPNVVVNV